MIRIGTRKSSLAIWQANHVKDKLGKLGFSSTVVTLKSSGDQDLIQPLYSMGIQGIFTKTLDRALLNDSIDIAVHSLKDVPTLLPHGIKISAYLKRGAVNDVIVYHKDFINWQKNTQIGTGSLRRRAQWLRKYPHHSTENLRGNLQKRLNKLNTANWGGAIFAQAGLERLNLLKNKFTVLDWMIPAPGQGIIGVASLEKNKDLSKIVQVLNCEETQLCAEVERTFLSEIEGGCSSPVGAYAHVENDIMSFNCGLFSLEGSEAIFHKTQANLNHANGLGVKTAIQVIEKGGSELMEKIKSKMR
jgi:hydroxymethylbilane synthase